MTYTSPKTGEPVNRICGCQRRLTSYANDAVPFSWARALVSWAAHLITWPLLCRLPAPGSHGPDGNEKFADNAVKIYEYLRDNDVYIAYTIVPPQIDRSKPAHQQNPPDLYAGVVEERNDGVIIKGAQMLGTGAVFADYIHLSSIHPLRPGDENHAISLIVPANAHGVKIHSRRSYSRAASSISTTHWRRDSTRPTH